MVHECENASFAYPTSDAGHGKTALEDDDLRIEPSSFLEIAGPTGGGESMLLDLTVGRVEPSPVPVILSGVLLSPAPHWWSGGLAVESRILEWLEQGLDTPIGDARIRLPVGQHQRSALARAEFWDPLVFALDELTSARNEATEARILIALRAESRPDGIPRTFIVVTSRVPTLTGAGQIINIEDGCVHDA